MNTERAAGREPVQHVRTEAAAPHADAHPLHASPRQAAQRARIEAAFGPVAQRRAAVDEEQPLQARAGAAAGGLPDGLRAGIESLSGLDMSGVRVHRNSDKPAQLQALAYAQGHDIHLAPGQEQHLPHEAWHVVQQAQVRVAPTRQLKGAVPVNDDEGLEREADVMGAMAVQGAAQLAAPGQRQHPDRVAPMAAPAPIAQRRIHAWNGQAWTPGERGMDGPHPLPGPPEGAARFFNDRTGQSAATAEEVADGLEHLAVQTGSVSDVMADGGAALAEVEQELPALEAFAIELEKQGWVQARARALADMEALNEEREQLIQDEEDLSDNEAAFDDAEDRAEYANQRIRRHDDPALVRGDSQVLNLGYFTFNAQDEAWKWDAGGDACPGGAWKDKVSALLRNFMIANGQMAYIRSRKWYGQDTHAIEIDVNYYINRPFSTAPLYWHKDTGGGNLFVNLLFTNERPIVGTEYTADTQPVGAAKKSSLLANMPAEQVDDIERAREGLKAHALGQKIDIGELPRKGYVAWVDELIWHSSPYLANRTPWTVELATKAMTDKADPNAGLKTETPTTYEAMVLIAATPGTTLGKWVDDDGEQLTIDEAEVYWQGGYQIGNEEYGDTVLEDIALVQWGAHKVNGAFGHEQDGADPRVEPSPDGPQDDDGHATPFNLVTPSGMAGRPRSASVTETQQSMKALVRGDEKGRNFLRTWVRIKPR